jgi:hypothetical protein
MLYLLIILIAAMAAVAAVIIAVEQYINLHVIYRLCMEMKKDKSSSNAKMSEVQYILLSLRSEIKLFFDQSFSDAIGAPFRIIGSLLLLAWAMYRKARGQKVDLLIEE